MLKKLPDNVQRLFCASTQVNSYKKAVEELVYNSIDAKSTSVAVRVYIEDGSIQVIDNGHGVTKKDLNLLGQLYMTSKFFDIDAFKSAPNYYGFRGESLANIIEVSQSIQVTSRYHSTEETWRKTFKNKKKVKLTKLTTRPSKGTTVEINGFLYNLRIQKRSTDALNELQDIKTFLEQLSLVHSNISLSLRDDSKNEIVLTIHKNRDIYQTLYTLFGIDKTVIQELQVEKNQYKVKAFMGKGDTEIRRHIIYLNGKFISHNSTLHKMVNLNLKNQSKKKLKNFKDDPALSKYNIPFYFVFISCPYIDYDVSNTPKQTALEFRNWDQINKLLEKLIQFYIGEVNLKDISIPEIQQASKIKQVNMQVSDTRDQVKKITDKILGCQYKKPRVSQMKNGITGKQIQRKDKKKPLNVLLSKVIPPKQNNGEGNYKLIVDDQISNTLHLDCNLRESKSNQEDKKIRDSKTSCNKTLLSSKRIKKSHNNNPKKSKLKKKLIQKQLTANKIIPTKQQKLLYNETKANLNNNKPGLINDPLISKFAMETDSVKRRCNIVAQKADKLLDNNNKRKHNMYFNETVQFSRTMDNKNMSIRHQYDEIVIHGFEPGVHTRNINHINKKCFQTTYDLVRTILKSQQKGYLHSDKKDDSISNINLNESCITRGTFRSDDMQLHNYKNIPFECRLTFQSHKYHKNETSRTENTNLNFDEKTSNMHFITIQSRDNFVALNDGHKHKNVPNFKSGKHNKMFRNNDNKHKIQESSYTIEFSNSNVKYADKNRNEISPLTYIEVNPSLFCKGNDSDEVCTENNSHDMASNQKSILTNGKTYTMTQNIDINIQSFEEYCKCIKNVTYNIGHSDKTYNLEKDYDQLISGAAEPFPSYEPNCNQEKPISTPESQNQVGRFAFDIDRNLDPINMCETILDNPDIFDREFEISYDNIRNECQQNNYSDNNTGKEHDLNNYIKKNSKITETQNIPGEKLYNFHNIPNNNNIMTEYNEVKRLNPKLTQEMSNKIHANEKNNKSSDKGNQDMLCLNNDKFAIQPIDLNDFNFKNRLHFLPKGMSPIFENCQTKAACKYKLDKDYYEDSIYDHFANNVQINSEIFEPKVQNVNATRDIDRFNIKLNKDKASLKFDGKSIKNAKVLGQVDTKFIAAIIKTKHNEPHNISEYLVLFDQHAVHERIRLEKNLSDYFKDNKWKSTLLDEVLIKVLKDEVLYLHNYTDKFTQFGLQWSIINNIEISLYAIPEAILGKNPRQVEIVIKAVKNLITEQINHIKLLRGCISLYPKSIMDLVFSEACGYAIKFGDKLSKEDCIKLLMELSNCKTPFQCAHGRPVMAVIMEIKPNNSKFKINISNLGNLIKK